jgi:sensor histidine kinase YesM
MNRLTNSQYWKKRLGALTLGAFLGLSLFSFLHYSQALVMPFWPVSFSGVLMGIFLSGFALVFQKIAHYYLPLKKTTGYHLLLVFISHTLLGALLFQLFWSASPIWISGSFQFLDLANPLFIKALILITLGSLVFTVGYYGLFSFHGVSRQALQNLQAQKEQTHLQLEALRQQLSPHFLFNNLNTISALISDNPQVAQQYIYQMGLCYQKNLKTTAKTYITLQEELATVKAYCYLMHIRLGQAFKVHYNLNPNYNQQQILPLSLQLLVENALKHNALSAEKPLEITLHTHANYVEVSNSLNPLITSTAGLQVGLQNIQSRYLLLGHKTVKVQKSASHFSVKLPWL